MILRLDLPRESSPFAIFALRRLAVDRFVGNIEFIVAENVLPLRFCLSCSSLKLRGVKNCSGLLERHRDKAISSDVPAVLFDLMNKN